MKITSATIVYNPSYLIYQSPLQTFDQNPMKYSAYRSLIHWPYMACVYVRVRNYQFRNEKHFRLKLISWRLSA